MFYELMEIGYNENFSYYGKNQGHYPIKIEEGVYIGMRANIILKYSLDDGGGYLGGRNALSRSKHFCKQRCARRGYGSWCSMQNHYEVETFKNEVFVI